MNLRNNLKNKVITYQEWDQERNTIKTSKQELNKMILNHFILEANLEAVEEFEQESGQRVEYDKELLIKRSEIRKLLIKGNIDQAINMINDIDEEILLFNKKLNFELLKLKLIEMIKLNKIKDALTFAKESVFPVAVSNEKNLEELKKLMLLLIYDDIKQSPLKEVVSDNYVKSVISCVNIEILKSRLQNYHPSLVILLKLMKHSQEELKNCGITFPEITDITPLKYNNKN